MSKEKKYIERKTYYIDEHNSFYACNDIVYNKFFYAYVICNFSTYKDKKGNERIRCCIKELDKMQKFSFNVDVLNSVFFKELKDVEELEGYKTFD